MSNKPTTQQMNEAIARYMGMEGSADFIRQNYQYEKSWDLLMPVVEKIETPVVSKGKMIWAAADVEILYKACRISYEPDEESGDTNEETKIQAHGKTKHEAVYKAVYQFIKWYNNQQSNEQA
jgi:hypothetical protein